MGSSPPASVADPNKIEAPTRVDAACFAARWLIGARSCATSCSAASPSPVLDLAPDVNETGAGCGESHAPCLGERNPAHAPSHNLMPTSFKEKLAAGHLVKIFAVGRI